MRLKGEILVSNTGVGVAILRELGHGVCEVLVIQDSTGEYAVGGLYRWSADILDRLLPGIVVSDAQPFAGIA